MLNVKGFPACNHELNWINLCLMFMSNMKSLYIKIWCVTKYIIYSLFL
jgi:hypothetical protein